MSENSFVADVLKTDNIVIASNSSNFIVSITDIISNTSREQIMGVLRQMGAFNSTNGFYSPLIIYTMENIIQCMQLYENEKQIN